jgi:hypothetical protein
MHLWITSATHAVRFRRMWGAIPFPVGHDYGKWGTIPLPPEKCPTSQRNPAPHRSGMLPHFKRNQCPTSTGIRILLNYSMLDAVPDHRIAFAFPPLIDYVENYFV